MKFGNRRLRDRLSVIVALIFLLVLYAANVSLSPDGFRSAAAPPDAIVVSTATREGRLAVFDDAWSTINLRYYDPGFHGLDWNAQKRTFRALAAEAGSSAELYTVLRRMIATLNDPHTRVFAPEEKFDWWRPRFITIGLLVREIGGLPTVVQIERGSAPERAGIRAGDIIEIVNGEPALSLVQKRLHNHSGPITPSARFRAFASLIDGPAQTTVAIRWKRKDGKEKSGHFRRYWQQRDLGLRVRIEKGGVAVVELDAFTKPIAASFAYALREKLGAVRGIVLDLRSNRGGDAEAMVDIASAFLGAGFQLGRFTDRTGSIFAIATVAKSQFIPERIEQTKVPLIVLTSERTSSAAEILISGLKESRRAILVGAETCGCVLAVRHRHELPDGGLLDISEMDYQTSSGERLERKGIKPDKTIAAERNDLYSGHDRILGFAVRELAKSSAVP